MHFVEYEDTSVKLKQVFHKQVLTSKILVTNLPQDFCEASYRVHMYAILIFGTWNRNSWRFFFPLVGCFRVWNPQGIMGEYHHKKALQANFIMWSIWRKSSNCYSMSESTVLQFAAFHYTWIYSNSFFIQFDTKEAATIAAGMDFVEYEDTAVVKLKQVSEAAPQQIPTNKIKVTNLPEDFNGVSHFLPLCSTHRSMTITLHCFPFVFRKTWCMKYTKSFGWKQLLKSRQSPFYCAKEKDLLRQLSQ